MDYKIIGIALLLASTTIAVPVIDNAKEIKQEQAKSADGKQCIRYVLEMIRNSNPGKLSAQDQGQIIKIVCGQKEDTKSERMRQWMLHATLLD